MSFSLKRSEILRDRQSITTLFKRGKRLDGKFVLCLYGIIRIEGGRYSKVLVAFSARKTLKRAVDRNRVKRLMREAYRLNKDIVFKRFNSLPVQAQILFTYKSLPAGNLPLPSYDEIVDDIKKHLAFISRMNYDIT